VELPAVERGRIDAALRLSDAVTLEVIGVDKELRAAFAGDERIRRLMAIPGVGFLTAAVVLAEVGDATRFACADRLASWAGLTPTERSSDEHTRRGHISKQGSRWLRWVMVERPRGRSNTQRCVASRKPSRAGVGRRSPASRSRGGCSRSASMRCETERVAEPSLSEYMPAHHGRSVQARSPKVMTSRTGRSLPD